MKRKNEELEDKRRVKRNERLCKFKRVKRAAAKLQKPTAPPDANAKPLRDVKGRLLPGQSLNRKGRPPGRNFIDEFCDELKKVEGKKRKTLMQHLNEQAFINNKVLVRVIDKILPTLTSIAFGGQIGWDLTPEDAEAIRTKLGARFNQLKAFHKGDDKCPTPD